MLPSKADALRNAEQLAGQGNITAAIAAYRGLLEADPLDFDSMQALGDLYVRAGRIQEALQELARLADRCLALGPPINAAPALKKMLDLDPSNTATRMKLATVYARAGRLEQAQQGFVEAGAMFARKGNFVAAAEAVKKALAINPDNPQARAALAALEGQTSPYVVQLPKGEPPAPRSEPSMSRSESSASRSEPPAPKPAAAKSQMRNTTELAELGQMLSSASVDFSADDVTDEFIVRQLFAAELLAGCGDIDKAVAVLKRIIDYRPDVVDVRTKLTDIYLRSGMMKEASHEFLEIARIYEGQGDVVRAKDYSVRAQRLAQQFEAPPASASPVASRMADEPPSANSQPIIHQVIKEGGPEPVAGGLPSPPAMPAVQPPSPPPVVQAVQPSNPPAAARVTQPPNPPAVAQNAQPARVVTEPLPAPGKRETAVTAALPAAPAPSAPLVQEPVRRDSKSMLGLVEAPAVVIVKKPPRHRRVVFYAVAASLVIALLGGWFAGRRWYAAEMDRAYDTLARASILPRQPQIPGAEQFNLPRSEERMEVRGEAPAAPASDAAPAAQPAAVARNEEASREEARKEPAAVPAANSDVPANRNTALPPSKSVAPPVLPTAPAVTTSPDRMPQGMPVSMPNNAGGSAPPPPVEARKAAVVIKGESIQRVQPDYPARAREARQSGAVAVEVSINERGEVVAAQAVSGPTLLRDSAVSAARRWKFKPATRDGKPVPSVSTITFNFKM